MKMANKKYDAIIIGAGIIGAPIAFELAKMGYKTLNIDKLPTSGYGSTSNSCAIVRAHYSTQDGVAMAYEGFKYWSDWANYLGCVDESGMAEYRNTGSILIKSQGHDWKKVVKHYDAVGVEYEEWTMDQLDEHIGIYSHDEFWPPSRPEEDENFTEPKGELTGCVFCPGGGYVNDPQLSTHNLQRAAEVKGAEFRYNVKVVDVRYDSERVRGVTLEDGTEIDAKVVLNAAGPYSSHINKMAGQFERMNVKTRVSRHEVHHIPAPPDLDLSKVGVYTPDADIACYYRPEVGNTFLLGSRDPDCDPFEIVDPDNYNDQITEAQWRAQVMRLAKRIPTLPIPNQPRGICDLYDLSDDWVPIYDQTDLPGYYVAIGTSGNQYKTAPVVGKMMAFLIDRCEDGHDHDAEPLDFRLENIGRDIPVGFFNRNRELKNTSYSVAG